MSSLDDVRRATCVILDDEGGISGTGFFVLPDGSLLTCHHVISGLNSLRVAVAGEARPREAVHVAECSDPRGDIAVLRVSGPPVSCVQLAKAREGVRAIGWGFRPSERETEPEGHAFPGTVGPAQRLRLPVPAHALGAPDAREGLVHVFTGASRMEQGISGGPVYDPELRAVVGIFRAVEGDELAYVISLEEAFARWPELVRRNTDEVPDEAIDRLARDYGIQLVAKGAPLVRAPGRRYFDDLFARQRGFGGRHDELRRLEEFVDNDEGGYFFVTGPAGFGKTALLANLTDRLASRSVQTAVHFITPTIDASEEFFLENLCQQLLVVHGLGGSLPASVRDLRLLLPDLLRLQPPEASRLVVVIDGLDEAVGRWTADPQASLFPEDLASGLCVVLSARAMADRDWAAQLELPLHAENCLVLGRLDLEEVGDVLASLPLALEDPGSVAARLFELTEGDPFYLKDLLGEFEQSQGDLQILADFPIGHSNYLKEWWDAGVEQAGADAFADLMGTLAVARSPLAREELLAVSADDALQGKDFGLLMKSAAGYVDGSNAAGYELSHGRIREFVGATLSDAIDTYRERLAAYCLRWHEPGVAGRARDYMLLHAAEHLAAAGRPDDLQALLSPAWIAAKWQRFGSYGALVHDLDVAANTAVGLETPDHAWVAGVAVARQSVRELMLGCPTGLLEVWIRLGENDRVLALLAELTETSGRAAGPLTRVAATLLDRARSGPEEDAAGSAEVAAGLLARSLGMLPLVRSSSAKLESLAAITTALHADCGLLPEQRRDLLAQARAYAETVWEPTLRAAALGLVAGALATSDGDRVAAVELLAESVRARDLIDFLPDRMIATAHALPALRRLEPERVSSAIRAALDEADDAFESSSLDKVPLRTLVEQWDPETTPDANGSVELLTEIGGLCAGREQGFILGHVANALCALGRSETALDLVGAVWSRSAEEGARAVHVAVAALHAADAAATAEWLERSSELTGYEHHDFHVNRELFAGSRAYALAVVDRWEDALELLRTVRPMERAGPLSRCLSLAASVLEDDPAVLAAIVAELVEVAAECDTDDRAEVAAAAAAALLEHDREAGERYAAQAVGVSLGELPEGDTDGLRRLLAVGLHADGSYDRVPSVCRAMKWLSNCVGTLSWLIEDDPANAEAAALYAEAIVETLLAADGGTPLVEEGLSRAAATAWHLGDTLPEAAERLCSAVLDGPLPTVDGYVRVAAAVAAARTRFDQARGLADLESLLEQAPLYLAAGNDLDARVVPDICHQLARIAPSVGSSDLRRLVQRALALSVFFDDSRERLPLEAAGASALATLDPEDAARLFRVQVGAVRQLGALPPGAPHLVRMLAEFTGRLAGPRHRQAEAVRDVGIEIATTSALGPEAAGLLDELAAEATAIESPVDRAQALADLFECCRAGPDELHDQLAGVYETALEAARMLPGPELADHALVAAVETFCRFGDLERARSAVALTLDPEVRQGAETTIQIAEERIEVGELTPFERIFVDVHDPETPYAVVHSVRIGETKELLSMIAQALAADQIRSERSSLLSHWVRLMALPARELGGTEAIDSMIEAVEDFDRRLLEAASLIAGA